MGAIVHLHRRESISEPPVRNAALVNAASELAAMSKLVSVKRVLGMNSEGLHSDSLAAKVEVAESCKESAQYKSSPSSSLSMPMATH